MYHTDLKSGQCLLEDIINIRSLENCSEVEENTTVGA